jgi:hypothetical protein
MIAMKYAWIVFVRFGSRYAVFATKPLVVK